MNHYDGTTSLAYQIAEVLNLCSIASTNKLSKLRKTACDALGLSVQTTGGRKSPADNLVIFEWLRDNVANKSAPDTTTDLFGIDTAPATPSNVARLTESFSNEMAHTPIQIRHVSHLNQSMQVVINADVILDIKATHALALDFRKVSAMHGRRVGELLLQVKAELKHGDFLPWFEKYVGVSDRQARRYMRDAKGLPPTLRTTNQIGHVSVLNPPVDLVSQVESLENKSLRLENKSLQNELLAAQKAADDLAAKVRFQKVQTDAAIQTADELRNNQAQIIDAKVTAATAIEINNTSASTQSLKKQISDLQDANEKQKKDLDAAVKLAVDVELAKLDNTIREKNQWIEDAQQKYDTLKQSNRELDMDVGARVQHTESLKDIKHFINAIAESFDDATDYEMPCERENDWVSAHYAMTELAQRIGKWIAENNAIEYKALPIIESVPVD
jgi:hypothetical protein